MSDVIAVTNRRLCSRPLTEQIERICRLSPKAIILREKDLPESEYALLAEEIMKICSRYGVPCILHTFVETAEKLNCRAIHLPLPLLRRYAAAERCGERKVIGTSVHSVEEAVEAEKLGATYITAGHVYATDCKKGLPPRGLPFLQAVCESISIPVYAIGGIQMDGKQINQKQMDEILSCGAAGGCVMSGMMKI
ncbi:MAG: thiamine phosphate synthase [Lachnospiraceae bacterium]|nr:thiamine phosphate synthase [Lachnospiraceae bacterium]